MSAIDKLSELFSKFPGVGQRQAKRFVYFLLLQNEKATRELTKEIETLKKEVGICRECLRFFNSNYKRSENLCSICQDGERESGVLMIVSYDTDLDNVEKSGIFKGKYFVLGGTIPILEKDPEKKIRLEKLRKKIEQLLEEKNLKEIILAMNFTPEGENTLDYLKKELSPVAEKYSFKISTLGKGLSMGLELEYSDAETLKNALQNRH